MKLHELHVHQRGSGVVGERMTVAGVLPAVAGNFVSSADSTGGKHHCFRAEYVKPPALAIVAKRACDAIAVLKQVEDGMLHENIEAQMDSMILQRANHLQAGPIPHVG